MELREMIVWIIGIVLIGLPFTVLTFFIVRRLRQLSIFRSLQGEIFINDEKEVYSQFYIPIDALSEKEYILLKVNRVKPDTKLHAKE